MREIRYKALGAESFARYGAFADMLDPEANKPSSMRIGAPPIEFFRDILQTGLGLDSVASFGVCRVSKRPFVIDASEWHDTACEAVMPIDGDVLMHVAPAVPEGRFPSELAEVFLVPKGTMAVLRPGVWHHGPYAFGQERVSCLVTLPERLYARDCKSVALDPNERIAIVGEGI
jgi:ureidoglycolate lyase